MKHFNINLNSSMVAWLQVAVLVFATFAPFLLSAQRVDAATVTSRSIEMADSDGGATGVDYDVAFTTASASAGTGLEYIVVEFCSDSPIPGETCTGANGIGFNASSVAITPGSFTGIDTTGWTVDGGNSDADTITLVDASPSSVGSTVAVTFTLENLDNPTNDNTSFYARIFTYDDTQDGSSYTSATPGTHLDDGGVALSTASDITVTARVQEVLEFCVGTESESTGDCSELRGSAIDLGVLDTSQVTYSTNKGGASDQACAATVDSTAPAAEDAECAILILTTNATGGGVVIDYFADGFGVGATCTTGGTTAGGATTDQCLNPVHEGAETAMTTSEEDWGIAVVNHQAGGTTSNLDDVTDTDAISDAYDYSTSGYAVNDDNTVSTRLAGTEQNDTTPDEYVTDSEQLEIEIAASPTFTTPSGSYQTTLTFVATGTF